jgi:hypothetical protein
MWPVVVSDAATRRHRRWPPRPALTPGPAARSAPTTYQWRPSGAATAQRSSPSRPESCPEAPDYPRQTHPAAGALPRQPPPPSPVPYRCRRPRTLPIGADRYRCRGSPQQPGNPSNRLRRLPIHSTCLHPTLSVHFWAGQLIHTQAHHQVEPTTRPVDNSASQMPQGSAAHAGGHRGKASTGPLGFQ